MDVEGNKKTDGQDGPPLIVPPAAAVLSGAPGNTPGAANAALKETYVDGQDLDPKHPCRGITEIIDAERALVKETAPDGTRRRKIAVCGFASSSRGYLPAHDPSWSIWGLNQLYRHIPRADRWFDIHHNWNEEVVPGTDYAAWLAQCGMPIYMLTRVPTLPTSMRYPVEMLLREFEADYFTSSIAYMVAMAIWEIDQLVREELHDWVNATSKEELDTIDMVLRTRALYATCCIGIFGVDLAVGEEYFHQKPCAEFWIGQAGARGIRVLIPPQSALCKQSHRYGYQRAPESLIKIEDILGHQQAVMKDRDEMVKKLWMMEGVIQCNDRWRQVFELRERGAVV